MSDELEKLSEFINWFFKEILSFICEIYRRKF
jgi:hypothetical protein